ncbi:MAG: Pyruvate-flavodoxin oxidoreductase [Actinobacteria bacterium ADurb.Bin346]|nr:MAG: Pyruvate-flavodoxin oxidoreductase [Actinobacteria bacterium ADurb.Bin346]
MVKQKMETMDGNAAATYVAYAFTDVAAIYPITPSSTMGEYADDWAAHCRKNLFGQNVLVTELQSEGGASGAVHGSLAAGALSTSFTASQGLLLMIPNMYKIAGELLPGVLHVSARTVATHALSIFGDHSDVMACRQTGWALLASGSVQEIMDLSAVTHLSAIKASIPFLHFFDGFRTSSEIQKISVIDYEDLARLLDYDAVKRFRDRALNPEHPVTRGTAQNPDIFFQAREAQNRYHEAVPGIVEEYMKKIGALTGRNYNLFDYYGDPDAENIIIAMGSVIETIEETIDYLNKKGEKAGLVKVRLYRPFSVKHFLQAIPASVKRIAVLDRTKEPGSVGEPLFEDVKAVFYNEDKKPLIIGGRYGLSSKDTTPSQIKAVFDNLKSEKPKDGFTIGINDDVTHYSLEIKDDVVATPEGTISCKFWGYGSDGTVGANKNSIKIIGDNTDMYAQGYFEYDSKKSGGVTISHLRFGKKPIKSPYFVEYADFIACHNQAYVNQYNLVKGLKDGGIFILNCEWSGEQLEEKLPPSLKRYIAEHNIDFYIIDATKIAGEIGLGNRINMIMQSAFFKLAKVIPLDDAIKYMKKAVAKTYGSKGEDVVRMNNEAIDRGVDAIKKVNVPPAWKDSVEIADIKGAQEPDIIKNFLRIVNRHEGDLIPVSAFSGIEDGRFPAGTAAYEKRGIAINVPEWQKDNCIQCNQCSYVCPHAVIRPFLLDVGEAGKAPSDFEMLDAKGKGLEGLKYRIQISYYDCTGCGNCADICPAKQKALVMKPFSSQEKQAELWDFAMTVKPKESLVPADTVKGSQFRQPLLEFSGACAGCGESPYVKLVTQLYGDRMLIAGATGCSSIWGASAPSMPYTKNFKGKGPVYSNSLFEDAAEYGYGMVLGFTQLRDQIEMLAGELLKINISQEIKDALSEWIASKENGDESKVASEKLLDALSSKMKDPAAEELRNKMLKLKDFFIKKSVWSLGGDGWAYDIGYGGLDHVLASNRDINVLVLDTEVYSNTGGQSSKATPKGAVAKFATAGKRVKKKDLALISISYGYIYVAQIAMGASMNQTLKAIREAEAYKGPSIVIAYSTCINHGIKSGMATSQTRQKQAVDSGYWHLFRYNPDLKKEGKNPFILDSKEPKESFRDFLMGEVRYSSLVKSFPEDAERLFAEAEQEAKEKYQTYKRMAEGI